MAGTYHCTQLTESTGSTTLLQLSTKQKAGGPQPAHLPFFGNGHWCFVLLLLLLLLILLLLLLLLLRRRLRSFLLFLCFLLLLELLRVFLLQQQAQCFPSGQGVSSVVLAPIMTADLGA